MSPQSLPLGLAAYRAATRALAPLTGSWLRRRAARGKEDPARLLERFGKPSAPRPEGPLVWLHGASVGESLMLAGLLDAIRRERPDLAFLVTTGTVTSAEMMSKRLPERAIHQFAPIDTIGSVRAFLDAWRPSLGVFAESELWPNLVLEAKARGTKLALVNARVTSRSLARWRSSAPRSLKHLLGQFDWIGAADRETAEGLSQALGRLVPMCGNLKLAGAPPKADPAALADLQAQIAGRTVWLAASTHPGEDEIVLEAHKILRQSEPDALLILAPRHPERGEDIVALAQAAGIVVRRRAAGESPDVEAAVYVADTLGELGLWLRVARAAVMCGSLVPRIGGHNPLEPVMAEAPVIVGPYTANFAELYDSLVSAGAAARVRSAAEIAQEIRILDGSMRTRRIRAAHAVASGGGRVLDIVTGGLRPLLPDREHG